METKDLKNMAITGGSVVATEKVVGKIIGNSSLESAGIKIGLAYFALKHVKAGSDLIGVVYGVGIDGIVDGLTYILSRHDATTNVNVPNAAISGRTI